MPPATGRDCLFGPATIPRGLCLWDLQGTAVTRSSCHSENAATCLLWTGGLYHLGPPSLPPGRRTCHFLWEGYHCLLPAWILPGYPGDTISAAHLHGLTTTTIGLLHTTCLLSLGWEMGCLPATTYGRLLWDCLHYSATILEGRGYWHKSHWRNSANLLCS